ncbi:ATP synthase subunit b [Thiohalobacter sp. COW1]|uniref:ATP synthase subunit b n=1 Tax=Thiohalobacter thiocyanaticus TaxID=585455 RepID=A0A1Z4VLZ8_9GAMM|nr:MULTISPECIES: F0F1 ATP synthase subunit B [Thiohalobacter]BAZ92631.1 ATP synthase subunit B [Thiohalobacter thiocyanaticus]BCO32402.1 ATP synthase subunit b [Thiohalobacter sp. COW1]
MNFNATLIGQMIAFVVFVWFCMKYVWPPMMKALDERKKTIADGLAAAERGQREQELAEERAKEALVEAKQQAQEIISRAEKRASEIVEEAKADARTEGERMIAAARNELDQELNRVKEQLRSQVAAIAVSGAEKVLEREVDEKTHDELLSKLAAQI